MGYQYIIPYEFFVPGFQFQNNSFNFTNEEEIVKQLQACCKKVIECGHFRPESVLLEENTVLLKVRLFNATVSSKDAQRGIVGDLIVPYMKYLNKKCESYGELLCFSILQWDELSLLKWINKAIINYEDRKPNSMFRIKEVEQPLCIQQIDLSDLFAGNVKSDMKKVWFAKSN